MYCPFCGVQWPTLPRFCSSCWRGVSFIIENDQVSRQTVPRVTDTFTIPAKSASVELKKTKRKTVSKNKKKSNKKVKISVGIMSITRNILKPVRGKSLPLYVDPQWSSEQLLEVAVKTLKDLIQDMEDGEYAMLYPDGSEVKNIPGTDTPFTIGQYKEAIGKAYQRITLYICCVEDLYCK